MYWPYSLTFEMGHEQINYRVGVMLHGPYPAKKWRVGYLHPHHAYTSHDMIDWKLVIFIKKVYKTFNMAIFSGGASSKVGVKF